MQPAHLGQTHLGQLEVPSPNHHSVPRHELHFQSKPFDLLLILEAPSKERYQRSSEVELRCIEPLVERDHMGPHEIFKEEIVELLLQW